MFTPFLQETATDLRADPYESIPHTHVLLFRIRFNIILS